MIKSFNVSTGVVIGTVVRIPTSEYFFVQNGDPRQVFCHVNQGGALEVSVAGRLVLNQNKPVYPPSIGDRVALVRGSTNPADRNFTQAAGWVPAEDWSWAVNANRTYRAVAYDHRSNGQFQGNTRADVELVHGTLSEIAAKSPKQHNDQLESGHSAILGTVTLSYKVRWERLETDDSWT